MALTFTADGASALDLAEFLSLADQKVDPEDPDSLVEMVPHFAGLYANRSFLVDALCARLRTPETRRLLQSAPSLRLHQTPRYVLRAVFWLPREHAAGSRFDDEQVLRYSVAHDHRFSFLTCGYHGPGYETWIYDYDPTTVARAAGEPVRLTFLEHTRLDRGKIMLYRAFRDVHHKTHPPRLSVSLNLMIRSRSAARQDQLAFDVERGVVNGFFGDSVSPVTLLCEIAGRLGALQAVPSLEALAVRHGAWRVRAAAWQAMAQIDPCAGPDIARRAAHDPHPSVRALAEKPLGPRDPH